MLIFPFYLLFLKGTDTKEINDYCVAIEYFKKYSDEKRTDIEMYQRGISDALNVSHQRNALL
jgi:hypothetical protein